MAYTPFLTQAGAAIGSAMESQAVKQQKADLSKLAGSAYMGDPRAMQELMQVNPALGAQIQEQAQKRADTDKQKLLTEQSGFQKDFKTLSKNIATYDTFEAAKDYAESEMDTLKAKYPLIAKQSGGEEKEFDKEMFDQIKQFSGKGDGTSDAFSKIDPSDYTADSLVLFQKSGDYADLVPTEGDAGAFAGTSMDAQVSNMLAKGVEDPAFRSTPDYARAWQLANEPRVIRTPTGDITFRPELSAVFKPPRQAKTDKEQIQVSKEGSKEDVEMIPGTEKEIKTSADEKTSFGFYNRMVASEDNIKKLGNFDSAAIWERFKGVTNMTASPELQQYRQAADDWIRAKLRRESGAVIGVMEMQKEYEIYFPQIGDSQAVMDQKKSSRDVAMSSMKTASGKAFKETKKTPEGARKITEVPAVGVVKGGYEFIGGDPSKQESWKKVP